MAFPINRPRRLRRTETIRRMVRETRLSPDDLILPMFVCPGRGVKKAVASMPGVAQMSVDNVVAEARETWAAGVPAVILFGIPERKDANGSEAWNDNGEVQRAIREIKERVPGMAVITDVCMCEYTDHGHCGALAGNDVDNDATLELLTRSALSHARAGADIVAPSDMMDGRVGAIRTALDSNGFSHVAIMAYSAKFASAFYGPFREAAESAPQFGDRRSYQMDPPNGDEAMREVALDLEEGADIVMVKPALALSRSDLPGKTGIQRAGSGVQRLRRVLDDPRRRHQRMDRRRTRHNGSADIDQARRRRFNPDLLRQRRRPQTPRMNRNVKPAWVSHFLRQGCPCTQCKKGRTRFCSKVEGGACSQYLARFLRERRRRIRR